MDGATVLQAGKDYGRSDVYWFSDKTAGVFYPRETPLWLEDFNIRLFPRTVDDVLAVNHIRAALESRMVFGISRDSWRQDMSAKRPRQFTAPLGESRGAQQKEERPNRP